MTIDAAFFLGFLLGVFATILFFALTIWYFEKK